MVKELRKIPPGGSELESHPCGRGCRQIVAGFVQELPGVLPMRPPPPHPVPEAQGGSRGAARRQQRSRGNFAHGARSPRCRRWAGGREAAAAPPTAETLDGFF